MGYKIRKYAKHLVKLNVFMAGIMVLSMYHECYGTQTNKNKIVDIQKIMEQEKTWIKQNQGMSGEIYQNYSKQNPEIAMVNPYFACRSVMGILSGNVTEEDLTCAASYLSWHSRQLIENQGVICNYKLINNVLTPTDKYDSVDSYVAVFLTLLAKYEEKGGDLSKVYHCKEAIMTSLETLKSITHNGITQITKDRVVFYLMNNVEVYEAYTKMAQLFKSDDAFVQQWQEREDLQKEFASLAQACQNGIYQYLWNAQEQRYEIGMDGNNKLIDFPGWNKFYPGAIAQVYPIASDFYAPNQTAGQKLYETFCSTYKWQQMDLSDELFDWSVLGYIAAIHQDFERAEAYLYAYEKKYSNNRKYPLYTAESSWVARTCELLLEHYEQQSKGMLENS